MKKKKKTEKKNSYLAVLGEASFLKPLWAFSPGRAKNKQGANAKC